MVKKCSPAGGQPLTDSAASATPATLIRLSGPCPRLSWLASVSGGGRLRGRRRRGPRAGRAVRGADGRCRRRRRCPCRNSSVQLMPHVGTHGAPRRVGRVFVCQGSRFGQELPAVRAVAGAGGRPRCPDGAGARCRSAQTPAGRAGGGTGSRSGCGPGARVGRSAPTAQQGIGLGNAVAW
jgi:hypothetical protein